MKRMLALAVALVLLAAALPGCAESSGTSQDPSGYKNGANAGMFMTIAETLPSCVAFEYGNAGRPYCFYAYDAEGKFYRVIWDMPWEGLHEKDHIYVQYTGDIRKLVYDEYPEGGYTPQYEITATRVVPERDLLPACLTHGEDGYTLTLPQSGETIKLREKEERFVPYITDELVEAAESKIAKEVSAYSEHSGFFLQVNQDYLCLAVEAIRYTEAPDGSDHVHLPYEERISTQAVKEIETFGADHEAGYTWSHTLYCSGADEISASSRLLWKKLDNGDGCFTETLIDAPDITDLIADRAPLIPTLFLDGPVTPLVPFNGMIEGVILLTAEGDGFVKREITLEALSDLDPGTYYVAVTVLLDGNCDPDAPQNSYRYEDLFCLEVRGMPDPGHGTPAQTLPSEMPDDFAIRFSETYLAEEFYDTYTGTIQKDLIENGTISAPFVPKEETLREIYAKVLEYQIYTIERSMTNDELADGDGPQYGVSPNYKYEITITADGNTYLIRGDDTAQGYAGMDADAKNFTCFVDFMRKTVSDTPEYQDLPEAVGGYA